MSEAKDLRTALKRLVRAAKRFQLENDEKERNGRIWDRLYEEIEQSEELLKRPPTPHNDSGLRVALEAISRRGPIMGSTGEYRRGQLDALEACRKIALAALSRPAGSQGKEGEG